LGAVRFIRSRGLASGFDRAFLRRAPLGEIPGDLGEAGERSVRSPQGSDDYARPEARSIFAKTPAFFLVDSGPGGDLQLACRFAIREILGRIKDREVFSNNLLAR